MKIAIVHDWLTGMRGGEKCLEVFCELFPQADLYTLLHTPGSVSPRIEGMKIHTSFLQHFPFVEKHYRRYLLLMPFAVRQWCFEDYDLILSSSHCAAKGIQVPPGTLHICYCYSPMRYIWDQFDQYFGPDRCGWGTRMIANIVRPLLQRWDIQTSRHVDRFLAISRYIQKRIKKCYGIDSTILYPPADTDFFQPQGRESESFFLIVSAFAPYKRLDLAVDAFNELGYPLRIIGGGQDVRFLKNRARPNIHFLGWLPQTEVRSYYERSRALVFPGEEDFGIAPLESQLMGRPVIAFGRGGVLETVIPDRKTWMPQTGIPEEKTHKPTGVFFYQQTPSAVKEAVQHFESIESSFDSESLRAHALHFDAKTFAYRMKMFIREMAERKKC